MQEDEIPFDGVIPTDHPETYEQLNTSYCYKQTDSIPGFIIGLSSGITFCLNCYEIQQFVAPEPTHKVINYHIIGDINYPEVICDICRTILLQKRPAIECGRCTNILIGN